MEQLHCTDERHWASGGACCFCCDTCNFDQHRCYACGEFIRHDNTNWKYPHKMHECYTDEHGEPSTLD